MNESWAQEAIRLRGAAERLRVVLAEIEEESPVDGAYWVARIRERLGSQNGSQTGHEQG
jgi:hypothetical protein